MLTVTRIWGGDYAMVTVPLLSSVHDLREIQPSTLTADSIRVFPAEPRVAEGASAWRSGECCVVPACMCEPRPSSNEKLVGSVFLTVVECMPSRLGVSVLFLAGCLFSCQCSSIFPCYLTTCDCLLE
ncbi:hypothetical protein J6590_002453 [Homalodisca vitripennis]|nr:hypothetical protein J6590_002453 [Homalodisca vitripennis]